MGVLLLAVLIAVGAASVLAAVLTPYMVESGDGGASRRWNDDGELELGDLVGDVRSLRERLVVLISGVVDRVDTRGATVALLARARLPLRSGEFVALTVAGGAVLGGLVWLFTAQPILSAAAFLACPIIARGVLMVMIRRREIQLEEDLPDAVSMVAASMNGGHTFQRSIQIVSQEMSGPIAEELSRVIHETRLGHNIVSALERMAERVQLESVDLMVDAVRIQHHLGGSMAELLHTIADSIRARQELKREVRVLTAEGRMSAWLLGALPLLLLVAIQAISPGYSEPLFQGWGLVWLAGCAASVGIGVLWIRKMSEIEI